MKCIVMRLLDSYLCLWPYKYFTFETCDTYSPAFYLSHTSLYFLNLFCPKYMSVQKLVFKCISKTNFRIIWHKESVLKLFFEILLSKEIMLSLDSYFHWIHFRNFRIILFDKLIIYRGRGNINISIIY